MTQDSASALYTGQVLTNAPGREAASTRWPDIERGKGLAIILVVLGHLLRYDTLSEPAWYEWVKHTIYYFHMPFFMYLSGFVFFLTGAQTTWGGAFGQYLKRRANRLLLPFVLFAVLIVTGKYLAGFYLYVQDRPDGGYWAGYYHLFIQTEDSPALSVWYVMVLFVYSVLTPVLWRWSGGRILWLLALAALLHFVPLTDDFYLDRVARFFVFFLAGGAMAVYRTQWLNWVDRLAWPALALFVAAAVSMNDTPYTLFVVGGLSLFALHGLVRMPFLGQDKLLYFFGRNSMVIYLFNTIFIGLAKGVFIKFFPYTGNWMFLLLLVTFCAGLLLPVLLKQVIDRFAFMKPVSRIIA
ncbi:fucose 4-O-acetylase-like acetyltransferase [Silvimonas terrae]|uniref:Fucose 4-O-acetylase-like acetyltransferase n=1 Tax=Silvimonas terrae TaxID=300266 RepID=A0A840REW8_9NEIS|nr:acyltransferase [Silvimonas terrae]MBB5190801.1 fucose 4-O-acetylase-like acetyltransferase [Silvimonas terrae]